MHNLLHCTYIFVMHGKLVNFQGMPMFDFLSRRYRRWKVYSRTVTELQSLSNRELADLGIARCDIPRVARERSIITKRS